MGKTAVLDETESLPAHLAGTKTGLPIPCAPVFASVDEERRHRKQRLAAAVRLFGKYGFGEGISGHISVRDAEDPDLFWVNPFGVSFKRVRVADLICVDAKGVVVAGDNAVNPSAFAIHSQIHHSCPNAEGIAHGHTVYSRAMGSLGRLLEPIDQESAAFYQNQVLYEDYNGPAISVEQGRDIAATLGDKTAILLRHHGLITAGGSLEEAVHWFFTFENCAQVQLLASRAGNATAMTDEQALLAREGFGDAQLAWFSFQLMWDEIVHEQPDLLDE
jgi:ribulose-5-phosphate 4-epimerase/fuculose-1-phosphate aldolase